MNDLPQRKNVHIPYDPVKWGLTPFEQVWASAEHWLGLYNDLQGNPAYDVETYIYGSSCQCCETSEYVATLDDDYCIECPIMHKTGRPDCEKTPWTKAKNALIIAKDSPSKINNKAARIAVADMYAWLVELAFELLEEEE